MVIIMDVNESLTHFKLTIVKLPTYVIIINKPWLVRFIILRRQRDAHIVLIFSKAGIFFYFGGKKGGKSTIYR